MTDQEVRETLKVGDEIRVAGVAKHTGIVTAITEGERRPVIVFEIAGMRGCSSAGFIEKVVPIAEPMWYGDLMEERG